MTWSAAARLSSALLVVSRVHASTAPARAGSSDEGQIFRGSLRRLGRALTEGKA
jgi:hypothetical protein